MDKSGFKPAWMKINSTDKINDKEKILHDRSLNSIQSFVQGVRNSTRQRHHSSTQNDSLIATRYGSTFHPKSNERSTENSFQFRRSYSREHSTNFIRKINGDDSSSNSFHFHSKTSSDQRRLHSNSSNDLPIENLRRLNSENFFNNENSSTRQQDFSSMNNNDESSSRNSSSSPDHFHSTLIHRRKERLASAPTHIDEKRSIEKIQLLPKSSHLIERFQNDVLDEQSAEKQFFREMGWNENEQQEFYQITEQDRENYEKRRQLVPKRHNRSAELMFALYRRSLPSINLQLLFQSNNADLLPDDDDDDENSDE